MTIDPKLKTLEAALHAHVPLAVAFSGGVDSTFLLAVASKTLRGRVMAVTVDTPLLPRREKASALRLAEQLGVRHVVLTYGDDALTAFRDNPADRCYICKKLFLGRILESRQALGFRYLAHGANLDDLDDYRPGLRAARELDVLAPLADAGMTKSDIRARSKEMGLPTWNQPSMACLATRIPYGTPLTVDALHRVESAEAALSDLGFEEVRVRCHGPVARIELAEDAMARILLPENRRQIVAVIRSAGFQYVSLDLEGYASGRMNRELPGDPDGCTGREDP